MTKRKKAREFILLVNSVGSIEPRDEYVADFDTVKQARGEGKLRDRHFPSLAPHKVIKVREATRRKRR